MESKGAGDREFINLLFKIEEEIKSLSYDERKPKRQEASWPALDAFWHGLKNLCISAYK